MEEPERIVGGLSKAKPATPEIQEIADKIKPQLEEKTNESYQEFTAIEYKTQVVAGTNYFIKIRVDNDGYVHVRVFEPLPGRNEDALQLSGYQTGKSKDDELSYF
ncbi:cystatin-A [Cavia porcellus]|uniref:Cystatin domain-containing protein n=1 Tax=Cavia porcellus TaxID=10141 RepID=A0A286XHS7_CAVPO|nr:cystatin-A [Cavia porcellus]